MSFSFYLKIYFNDVNDFIVDNFIIDSPFSQRSIIDLVNDVAFVYGDDVHFYVLSVVER